MLEAYGIFAFFKGDKKITQSVFHALKHCTRGFKDWAPVSWFHSAVPTSYLTE